LDSKPPSDSIVTLQDVSVLYGERRALSHVTVRFGRGATGLLGQNGAGKSTLIRAMLGLAAPSEGRIDVLGFDALVSSLDVRARIGYVPERDAQIPGLTAIAFVAYCGELAGLPRIDALQRAHDVLSFVGLHEARYREVDAFSTGMKQRLKLAQALVHDPELLLLDEPTDGLDPKGRDDMLMLIADLVHRHGFNIILSTHLLPDIERTCDAVVVLHGGRVAAAGSLTQLRRAEHRCYKIRIKGDHTAFTCALCESGLSWAIDDEQLITVTADDVGGSQTQRLFAIARNVGAQIRHLRAQAPTLEDVFVSVTGLDKPQTARLDR
jgi:ABC-2 type transport system ATP-binding protein